jgi:hypothetical protein
VPEPLIEDLQDQAFEESQHILYLFCRIRTA